MRDFEFNASSTTLSLLAFSGLIFVGTQLRVGSIEKPQVEAFHNYAAQRLINLKAAQAQADEALQKREEQIAHAADLEKVYAALLTELLEVASVDSSAKAITQKWKIQQQGEPTVAPLASTASVEKPKPVPANLPASKVKVAQ